MRLGAGVDLDFTPGGVAKARARVRRTDEYIERRDELRDIARRYEQAGSSIVDDLGNGVEPGSDGRQARAGRFLVDEAEGFVPGRQDEQVCGLPGGAPFGGPAFDPPLLAHGR